mmetsp:Transcript_16661/g.40848  ORF Transcript_16661/g.40848 Transcript_16661/m.40848 type:complete len:228 (-) Transcript_16661:306-989(-)
MRGRAPGGRPRTRGWRGRWRRRARGRARATPSPRGILASSPAPQRRSQHPRRSSPPSLQHPQVPSLRPRRTPECTAPAAPRRAPERRSRNLLLPRGEPSPAPGPALAPWRHRLLRPSALPPGGGCRTLPAAHLLLLLLLWAPAAASRRQRRPQAPSAGTRPRTPPRTRSRRSAARSEARGGLRRIPPAARRRRRGRGFRFRLQRRRLLRGRLLRCHLLLLLLLRPNI